ncbi:hypothetical protein BDF20DRAFT_857749 [Mycotypha africana]|uniref:uncharacterized protein n=1 Tax=Mycotypha africana TaxID=64632 RepID=UPI0023015B41|nr:uncharacterized protein BDF20DRAFT_857749 [Mycotypha africana]KAI8984066.1 hypothetical protein BDF20DRAFT_857749 [Mycotypha africana]
MLLLYSFCSMTICHVRIGCCYFTPLVAWIVAFDFFSGENWMLPLLYSSCSLIGVRRIRFGCCVLLYWFFVHQK